jgi:hypothetical protein
MTLLVEKEISFHTYDCEDTLDLKDSRNKIGTKTVISELWKQLGFKIDLFRISLPSIMLHPVSLLEKFSTLPTPCSIMYNINNEKKELRAQTVLAWLMYGWRNSHKKTLYLTKRK